MPSKPLILSKMNTETAVQPMRRTRSTRVSVVPVSGMQGTVLHFLNQIGEDSNVEVLKSQPIQAVAITVHEKMRLNKETGAEEKQYFLMCHFQTTGDRVYLRPTHDLVSQGVLRKTNEGFAPAAEEMGYIASEDPTVPGTFQVPTAN